MVENNRTSGVDYCIKNVRKCMFNLTDHELQIATEAQDFKSVLHVFALQD